MVAQHKAIMNELIYQNYKANRLRTPHISPERWMLVYSDVDVDALETRFQQEKDAPCKPTDTQS